MFTQACVRTHKIVLIELQRDDEAKFCKKKAYIESGVEVEGGIGGSVQVDPEAMSIGCRNADDSDAVSGAETIDGNGHGGGLNIFYFKNVFNFSPNKNRE